MGEEYTSIWGSHGAGQTRGRDCVYRVATKGLSLKQSSGTAPFEAGVYNGICIGTEIQLRTFSQKLQQ